MAVGALGALGALVLPVACGSDGCSDGVGDDSRITVLDAASGEQAWARDVDHYRADGRCEEGDVIGVLWVGGPDQVVYEDAAHTMWGLDPGTGAEQEPDLVAVASSTAGVAVGPDGRRYEPAESNDVDPDLVAGGDDVILADQQRGRYTQLARTGGPVAWRVDLPRPQDQLDLVAGSGVVVATGEVETAAFDLATGALRWQRPSGDVVGRPAVAGDAVVLSVCPDADADPDADANPEPAVAPADRSCPAGGDLVGLDAATGAALWALPGVGEQVEATAGDSVVTVEADALRLRRAADGAVAWEAPIPSPDDAAADGGDGSTEVLTQPGEDGILVVRRTGLHMFATADGSLTWSRADRLLDTVQRYPHRVLTFDGASDT